MQFGEENDAISEKVHRLSVALAGARDFPSLASSLYFHLREDFAVPHVALRVWGKSVAADFDEAKPVDDAQPVQPENLTGVPQIAPDFQSDDKTLPDLGRVGVDMMQQRPLGLREAISRALENNKDIEVSRQNVRIAVAFETQVMRNFDSPDDQFSVRSKSVDVEALADSKRKWIGGQG